MPTGFSIVNVTLDNVDELGFFCVQNRKHPGYVAKRAWLEKRFIEGLRIKLIRTADGRSAGFLEYSPGAHTWRVVEAENYMVIHCLWVASNKYPLSGMTAALFEDCLADAHDSGMAGVAVVTSDGPWMAGQEVFRKYGFQEVDQAPPRFKLLVRQIGSGPPPCFPQNWEERLGRFRGLQLIFSNQCPYIGKAVAELPAVADRHGVQLEMVEIESPEDARRVMPTPYGVIALVHDGRLLADHPISATRFRNILQKELNLKPGLKQGRGW